MGALYAPFFFVSLALNTYVFIRFELMLSLAVSVLSGATLIYIAIKLLRSRVP